jgi:hypothetical protein
LRERLRKIVASPILYTMLFAAYPVIFLWAHNRGSDVSVRSVMAILGLMLGGALVLFVVFSFLLHDRSRAGIATTILVLLFGSFGHLADYVEAGAGTIEETGLLIAWGLFGVTAILLVRGIKRPERATRSLNLVSAVLVGMNILPVVPALAQSGPVATARWDVDPASLHEHATGPARDVYYLIFDRYAGAQTLTDLYGVDNTPFLDALRSKGFTVVDNALANYPQTTHSLASSLNMTYLDDLAQNVGLDSSDWGPLYHSFPDPAVVRAFRSMGYRYEHVGSWWQVTWDDPTADHNFIFGGPPEFGQVFLDTTLLPTISRRLGIVSGDFERQAYERIGFQVDSLRTIAQEPGPTFTFAHFLLPHPPYVFHADGSYAPPGDGRPVEQAYLEQLSYCNTVIQSIVDMLQSQPGPEPIIVVQSDEGPHPPELDDVHVLTIPWSQASDTELGRKLRILNAYYLPGLKRDPVYPDITPVNSFRMILDRYYGAALPLLPDRTFIYTDYGHPYRFDDVTSRLRPPP